MSQTEIPGALLKRDRLVVWGGIIGLTLLAWGYMVYEARGMADTGVCRCAGMKMSGPDAKAWSLPELIPLFLMWSEMMVAMMIPSAAPMILMFARVNRNRREREQPFVPTGIFVAGYLAVWTAFQSFWPRWPSGRCTAWLLLSPGMVSTSPVSGCISLLVGGSLPMDAAEGAPSYPLPVAIEFFDVGRA